MRPPWANSARGPRILGRRGFRALLLAVGQDGDQSARAGEEAIKGPGGEDGAFAELASPVQAEDAGGVVFEIGG